MLLEWPWSVILECSCTGVSCRLWGLCCSGSVPRTLKFRVSVSGFAGGGGGGGAGRLQFGFRFWLTPVIPVVVCSVAGRFGSVLGFKDGCSTGGFALRFGPTSSGF